MKFDITIKDATAADLTAIANVLNGSVDVKPTESPVVHLQQLGRFDRQPAKEEAARSETPQGIQAPETDSTGMPWDERIHASTKATTKDGVWKKRRGVPELTVDQVEAELRGVAVEDTSPAEQPQAPSSPALPQFPAAPQAPAAPAVPQAPQVAARDFNSALTRIQSGFQQGKMNANTVKEISDALSVASITDINGNQPLIDQAHILLDGYGV